MTALTLAHGNFLRPNGHGGYLVRQSDLSSWSRCQLQKYYYDLAASDPDAQQPEELSATNYGTVYHFVSLNMELRMQEGAEDALQQALRLWDHYWDPVNISAVPGATWPTQWIGRQTYMGLKERGRQSLRIHHDMLAADKSYKLALEYQFAVPIEVNGRLHTLTGTVDRLAIRVHSNRKPYVALDDNKGLWIGTPLPTPTGWTTMGDVKTGDQLLGADGHPVTITEKHGVCQRDAYKVTFEDHSSIICDNVHLWDVMVAGKRYVLDPLELQELLHQGKAVNVRNAAPIRGEPYDFPIDPYVLGVWLGDGNRARGVITSADPEIFREIEDRLYELGTPQIDSRSGVESRTILGLQAQLDRLGILGAKSVPQEYLRAPWRQRLDLLRGLMDSDGCWHKSRRHAVFSNTDETLVEAVRELVVSMGWKARVWTVQKSGFGIEGTTFQVTFTPVDHNPFLLARKADLVNTLGYGRDARARRRRITSVQQIPTVATQCIRVDAPDSLFLAGEQMVPTHNTGKKPSFLRWNNQGTAYAYASTTPEFWTGWQDSGMGALEVFDAETIDRLDHLFSSHGYALHSGSPAHRERGLPLASRRFRWIDLRDMKFSDGGWRTQQDYERLRHVIDSYIRACEAEIYSVNLTADVCQYCPFRKGCAGVGLPEPQAGAPL